MPSPIYSTLLHTVSSYMDGAKAKEVIDRQLATNGTNPDSLDKAGLVKVVLSVTVATKLYVSDKTKQAEMAERIKNMAA